MKGAQGTEITFLKISEDRPLRLNPPRIRNKVISIKSGYSPEGLVAELTDAESKLEAAQQAWQRAKDECAALERYCTELDIYIELHLKRKFK